MEPPESPARDPGTRIHSPASEPSSEIPCGPQLEALEYILSYQEANTTLGQLGHCSQQCHQSTATHQWSKASCGKLWNLQAETLGPVSAFQCAGTSSRASRAFEDPAPSTSGWALAQTPALLTSGQARAPGTPGPSSGLTPALGHPKSYSQPCQEQALPISRLTLDPGPHNHPP